MYHGARRHGNPTLPYPRVRTVRTRGGFERLSLCFRGAGRSAVLPLTPLLLLPSRWARNEKKRVAKLKHAPPTPFERIRSAVSVRTAVLYGDPVQDTRPSLLSNPTRDALLFAPAGTCLATRGCVPPGHPWYPRTTSGLDTLVYFFVSEARALLDESPERLTPANPHFDFVVRARGLVPLCEICVVFAPVLSVVAPAGAASLSSSSVREGSLTFAPVVSFRTNRPWRVNISGRCRATTSATPSSASCSRSTTTRTTTRSRRAPRFVVLSVLLCCCLMPPLRPHCLPPRPLCCSRQPPRH